MRDTDRLGELEQGDDRWIAPALFQSAQVLLAEPRTRFDLLLREALLATKTRKVSAHQPSHIHAGQISVYIL